MIFFILKGLFKKIDANLTFIFDVSQKNYNMFCYAVFHNLIDTDSTSFYNKGTVTKVKYLLTLVLQ